MKELQLEYGKILRVWENEEICKIPVRLNTTKTYQIKNFQPSTSHTIIVELFVPLGGRNLYGLLGANFIADGSGTLKVLLPFGKDDHRKTFENSLIKDTVYIGIKKEFRNCILQALDKLNEINLCGLSGELQFYYGAYNEVSSNGWEFDRLTKILIKLFKCNKLHNGMDVDELQKILKRDVA